LYWWLKVVEEWLEDDLNYSETCDYWDSMELEWNIMNLTVLVGHNYYYIGEG